jgi:hypothetical protein
MKNSSDTIGNRTRDLPTCSAVPQPPSPPRAPLYNGYRFLSGGKERPGRDADPSPPSSAVGHERVELYLYSPCGPYSLCRASVPVQGCTLRFSLLPDPHDRGTTVFRNLRNRSPDTQSHITEDITYQQYHCEVVRSDSVM